MLYSRNQSLILIRLEKHWHMCRQQKFMWAAPTGDMHLFADTTNIRITILCSK